MIDRFGKNLGPAQIRPAIAAFGPGLWSFDCVRSWFLVLVLAMCVLSPVTVRAQQIRWTQHAVQSKEGGELVFDSFRGVCVLVGADIDNPASVSETMEWDGIAWSMRATGGRSPRNIQAMAYDPNRRVTVMFGGQTASSEVGETWEWNGTAWTLRATTGPSPRAGSAMVYDLDRQITVLFGGGTNISNPSTMTADSETWEWNGTIWTRVATTGPSPRIGHSMVYDAVNRTTLLFGGAVGINGQYVFSGETWSWNGATRQWTRLVVNGPAARAFHGMAYDSFRGRTVLFGGVIGLSSDLSTMINSGETWEWNGSAWMHVSDSGPSPRNGSGMAFDSLRRVVVLNGGSYSRSSFSSETWEWDGTSWILRVRDNPEVRQGHAMAYDGARHVSILFGGRIGYDGFSDETWVWNGAAWSKQIVAGPPSRGSHAMAYDSGRQVTVLFGGLTYTNSSFVRLGETWEWNGTAWVHVSDTGPSPREGHAMAYDSIRGVTVLFGGFTGLTVSGETWEWNGSGWTLRAGNGPPPQYSHAMAFDAARGVTVLFGGSETWEWNGQLWTQRLVSGPSVRSSHKMAYDSSRGVTILFGGYSGSAGSGDTWEWNGTAWTQLSGAAPAPRWDHAMAYDAARRVTVLFGGITIANLNPETWELGGPPSLWSGPTGSEQRIDYNTGNVYVGTALSANPVVRSDVVDTATTSGRTISFHAFAGTPTNGSRTTAIWGETNNPNGRGLQGFNFAPGAWTGSPSAGLWGESASSNGQGVRARATSATGQNYAGYLDSASNAGAATYATASNSTGTTYGVWGNIASSSGFAGYFTGGKNYFVGKVGIGTNAPSANLHVVGTLTASGAKNFLIDHPSDPENKILRHSCVESDGYKDMYDGIDRTDGQGYAVITLPDWFCDLNQDFRYHLTVLDDTDEVWPIATISKKIDHNTFTIRTLLPNTEVSWQITATRKDAWAGTNPLVLEEPKIPQPDRRWPEIPTEVPLTPITNSKR